MTTLAAVPSSSLATDRSAYNLYRACMNPEPMGVYQLKDFMRERGLLWPEYGSTGRHALYVVLDMLINWGIPFWFEMSLRRLPSESRGEADNLGLYMLATPLSIISAFTPNISSGIWLSYLNELLSPYRLQSTDKVLIDDMGLPKAMGRLFGQFR
ncbi:hypothetical protein HPB51_008364 [Rhipicephalus microplus]|uniref:Uncharacterized protein n=1 Tax=Rhipicephalus microplus TaxID=6941 RepID=A0A9J6DU13_RHIMP|nr:hypothetical protein HPB51_008364 [Rhipicephalus microplus]